MRTILQFVMIGLTLPLWWGAFLAAFAWMAVILGWKVGNDAIDWIVDLEGYRARKKP